MKNINNLIDKTVTVQLPAYGSIQGILKYRDKQDAYVVTFKSINDYGYCHIVFYNRDIESILELPQYSKIYLICQQ